MKVAIFPGTFDPWHKGHEDILQKAKKLFDQVVVCVLQNPDNASCPIRSIRNGLQRKDDVKIVFRNGMLKEVIDEFNAVAVIRGIRNGSDLEYEKVQQYWNEDLQVTVPFVYLLSDRSLVHISSSAIRAVRKLKGEDES